MEKDANETQIHEWEKIFQKAKESGMSKRAFCKANGISRNSFFSWQKIVRNYTKNDYSGENQLSEDAELPVFCEVRPIDDEPKESQAMTARESAKVIINLEEYQICVMDEFEETTLLKVLRVIRHA